MEEGEGETIVLEIGAGTNPDPESTHTLDIRTDIQVDFPGVDIAEEDLPFDNSTVDRVLGKHVLEHIQPHKVGHVFLEINRVLKPGGTGRLESPHAGTWSAGTDPTHQGPGGITPDIEMYLEGSSYWPEINWNVNARAELEFPTFLRPSLRASMISSKHSRELVKIPFVDGTVIVEFEKIE